jgi:signal recognition particle subunit SRP54
MDGDAKGGAALSIRAVTNIPIKFISTGEKTDALEQFYPDRLAQRILGMGDVLSLIEKAEATMDRDQAEAMEKKLRTNSFTLEDFLIQLQQIKKMGPLSQLIEMIPGMRGMARAQGIEEIDDKPLKKIEAIINSMTPQERRSPEILNASRKRRVAKGSATEVQDIN